MPSILSPALCLVTDRRRLAAGCRLEEVVERAVEGGAKMVQLRDKILPAAEMLALACRLREVTRGRALLFINDRVDVALACEADGVQLGEEGLPVEAARRASGGGLLLGRSVHSVEGAAAAEAEGVDMVVVGTIFESESHPGASAAGVGLVRRVSDRVRIPALAIGGITSANVSSVIAAGASGAAVIGDIVASDDPERAARALVDRMNKMWSARAPRTVSPLT
jgi:thiamine-phosphate pyrophosphorylase